MAESTTTAQTRVSLDLVLDQYFETSIKRAAQLDPSYQRLWETLHGLIRSGGKRLRPQMTLLAYRAFDGKDTDNVIPIAAAQELLHFCLLIHDDIIDRDYVRYGTLNIAGQYKVVYSKFIADEIEQIHFAHSAAILAGDLMLSGAHELITTSKLNDEDRTYAQLMLTQAVFEVAGGELIDTELSFVPYTDGDALKVARYKTAGYSFVSPLLTGAKLAGADSEQIELLREFAISLGIAFQLVDDLLGTFGEEETTGKSTTSDIVEGKRTFMVEQAMNAMSPVEKSRFEQVFGSQTATLNEIEDIKQLFISTGAKAKTEHAISEYAQKAAHSLELLNFSETHKEEFTALVRKVTERAY